MVAQSRPTYSRKRTEYSVLHRGIHARKVVEVGSVAEQSRLRHHFYTRFNSLESIKMGGNGEAVRWEKVEDCCVLEH